MDYVIRICDPLEKDLLDLNKKWAKIVIILNQGYFGLLKKYKDELISLNLPKNA